MNNYQKLWEQILTIITESENNNDDDLVLIDQCLEKNLELINFDFADYINNWLKHQLNKIQDEDQIIDILVNIYLVSDKIFYFQQGNEEINEKITINILNNLTQSLNLQNFGKQWAYLQNILGDFYNKRNTGDKSDNQNQAINYYKSALKVYTYEDYPEEWAETQFNIAKTYSNKIEGDQQENQEIAINSFKTALRYYNIDNNLAKYIETNFLLADIYQQRIKGNLANNLEKAIGYYHQALTVCELEDNPEIWGLIYNDLALTYTRRIKGNFAENKELAINCFKESLRVFTKEDDPEMWTLINSNLGFAYSLRSFGSQSDNIEQSINYCTLALEFANYDNFPDIFGRIKGNLGKAYLERIKDDFSENIETAIKHLTDALPYYNNQNDPEIYLVINLNLGFAYLKRIEGNESENIENAIRYFQNALIACEPNNYNNNWGKICNNLGQAYQLKEKGNKQENLNQAINYYQQVLEYSPSDSNIESLSIVNNNLGLIYLYQLDDNPVNNIEKAIAYFQEAIKIFSKEINALQWSMFHNNLGKAYSERIKGNKAENIELAIEAFNTALSVRNKHHYLAEWIDTKENLLLAYKDRLYGDPSENIEIAIKHCQDILDIIDQDEIPEMYANFKHSLASLYLDRIEGEKEENIEQAINYYNEILTIYQEINDLEEIASINSQLGIAYRNRIKGDQQENLETAINYYQLALEFFTFNSYPDDWAMIQNNLGNVYADLTINQSENLATSLNYYQSALTIYTYDQYPEDWALVQSDLALVYDKLKDIDKAIDCCQLALEIYTINTYPDECRRVGINLGDMALENQLYDQAITGYSLAIEASEKVYNWTKKESTRHKFFQEDQEIYQNMIKACIYANKIDLALQYLEKTRSRRLAEIFSSNDFTILNNDSISTEMLMYIEQFEALQNDIDQERFKTKTSNFEQQLVANSRATLEAVNENIKFLEQQKQKLWQQIRQLDPILASEIKVTVPDLLTIQNLIDYDNTAILSFYLIEETINIFVIKKNDIGLHSSSTEDFRNLPSWINNNWLQPYLLSCDLSKTKQEREQLKLQWKNKIEAFLNELSEYLQLDQLISNHLTGIEELIIIPHLYLHQIPFAALPLNNGYLGDKFLIRYIPSCQILEFCQNRPPVENNLIYGIVEDATEDLHFTNFECSQIANLHQIPEHLRLRGKQQATVNNYRQLLQQENINILLSSHHASSRLDNPLESKLILADGEITLGQLMTPAWRLPNLSDVFLSCCETGLSVTEITDDPLTLAAGFLCAGARNVVSTLWSVDDLATSLFSIFYHTYRQQGSCRVAALQQAQEELRNLTGETLTNVYQPQLLEILDSKFKQAETARKETRKKRDQEIKNSANYQQLDTEYKQYYKTANNIRNAKKNLNYFCQQNQPFNHPYYWAGFICSGLR
jgi:CHAT domain-containing protein/tetratricopeptide (TPR) repeat protein